MRKNKYLVLIILLLVVCSGLVTYALFRSNKSGSATINAARWNVVFKNGEEEISNNFDISLNNATWTNPLGNVASGKIAPGSQATFYITIDATNTETDVDYTVELEDTFDETDFEVSLVDDSGTIAYSTISGEMIKQIPIQVIWTGNINDDDTKNENDLLKKARNIVVPIKVTAAQKLPLKYTIYFNSDGVTVTSMKIDENTAIGTLPSAPTKEGYRFIGWFSNEINGDEVTIETIPLSSTIYYAHWETSNINVYFDPVGGLTQNNSSLFSFNASSGQINGITHGITWGNDYIKFAGNSSSWVNLGQINNDNMIINIDFSIDEYINNSDEVIIGNIDNGGLSININSNKNIVAQVHINGSYKRITTDFQVELNRKYSVMLSYDGNVMKLYVDGNLINKIIEIGNITQPSLSTVMVLGANPIGNDVEDSYFKGKIYSASIYTNDIYSREYISNSKYGSLPEIVRNNYIFKEWNTKEDGTGTTILNDSLLVSDEDHTLYAIYIKNNTISFESNGGITNNNNSLFTFNGSTGQISGITHGITFEEDYMQLAGNSSSWVNLGQVNNGNLLINLDFSIDEYLSNSEVIIGNIESGGICIYINDDKNIVGQAYINGSYRNIITNFQVKLRKKYNVTLSYDGFLLKMFVDGILIDKININGSIKAPENSTVMAIGGNPSGNTIEGQYFKGKIYNASIYTNNRYTKNIVSNSKYGELPTSTRNGVIFKEWNTKEDGTGIPITSNSDLVYSNDHTLYAIFYDNIIVSFDSNGGSIQNNISLFDFDASSGQINGTTHGITWGTNYIQFAGNSSSWVNLGQINNDNILMNVEFSIDEYQSNTAVVIGNIEDGGASINITDTKNIVVQSHVNGSYRRITTDYQIELGKKYNVTLSYDGQVEKMFVNGILIDKININGKITVPSSSTVMALGGNSKGNIVNNNYFKGKVYSASIYTNDTYTKYVTPNYAYGDLPIPIKKGFTFIEWNTKEDGTGSRITNISNVSSSINHTLYAIYEKNNN